MAEKEATNCSLEGSAWTLREKFLAKGVLLHWNKVPREFVQTSPLVAFKIQMKKPCNAQFSSSKKDLLSGCRGQPQSKTEVRLDDL